MTDYENDPQFIAWAKRAREELVPKIEGSAVTVSLVPEGEVDVKFAVELGLSIMLNKPIILVVAPGTKVPDKLALVATEIVEVDWRATSTKGRDAIGDAIMRVVGP